MSDAALADFNKLTDSFSTEELVSAISILSEKLKKIFINEETNSLEDDLLAEREEIREQMRNGTLQTYSTMEEYRRAKSI